jgi:hypothetical protein
MLFFLLVRTPSLVIVSKSAQYNGCIHTGTWMPANKQIDQDRSRSRLSHFSPLLLPNEIEDHHPFSEHMCFAMRSSKFGETKLGS